MATVHPLQRLGRAARGIGGATALEVRGLARFSRSRPGFLFGLGIVALTLVLAAFGPHLGPYGPEETLPGRANLPPSAEHWMGTDISGMDVFSRVIAAPRIDLTIALLSTAIAFAVGIVLGVVSGFFAGGRGVWALLSGAILRGADIFQAFPVFIFALALVGFRGPSIPNVIVALAFLNVPFFLRVTRGAVLNVRERPFVEAARCVGGNRLRIAFVHVMPSALTPALANLSPTIGFSILLASALSFVGAGVPVPTPEWGSMIAIGAPNMMTGQWWTALFPGLALGLTILGYALVGDGLRYYLDPVNRR
jgi:peptide/nickel transport system permease protein